VPPDPPITTDADPPGRHAPINPGRSKARRVARVMEDMAREVAELDPKVMRKLLPVLSRAKAELRQGLLQWYQQIPGGNERFTAYQMNRALASVNTAIRTIREAQPGIGEAMIDGATEAGIMAGFHVEREVARLAHVFGGPGNLAIMPTQIDTAALVAAGQRELVPRFRTSAARYVQNIRDDIRLQFGIGLAKGETYAQMTSRLRRLGGPRGLVALRGVVGEPGAIVEDISEGLFRRYQHWGERLVRTEMQNAYNAQHLDAIEQLNDDLPEGDVPFRKRWDASADFRLCALCRELDGVVVDEKAEFPGGVQHPPRHPNCRCVVVAWHPEWDAPVRAPRKPRAKPKDQPKPKATKPRATKKKAPPGYETHLAKGQWSKARQVLDADLSRQGFAQIKRAPSETEAKKRLMRVRPSLGDAAGLHHWDGAISITNRVAKMAKEFAEKWAPNPAEMKRVWKESAPLVKRQDKVQAAVVKNIEKRSAIDLPFQEQLTLEKWSGVGAVPEGVTVSEAVARKYRALWAEFETLDAERSAIHAQLKAKGYYDLKRGVWGTKVVNHEAFHGFGPVVMRGYRFQGAVVEEVTTEVLARRDMMKRFGVPAQHFATGGSYSEFIDPLTDEVAKVWKVSRPKARKIVEEASDRFKRIGRAMEGGNEISAEFARSFPPTGDENLDRRSKGLVEKVEGEYVELTHAQGKITSLLFDLAFRPGKK